MRRATKEQRRYSLPLTRRLYDAPDARYHHDAWAESMRRTAARLDVALIDLTHMSERLVDMMGENAKQLYMNLPAGLYPHFPDGLADNTHLQPEGALHFGGMIAHALHDLGGKYAALLSDDFDQWQEETMRWGMNK